MLPRYAIGVCRLKRDTGSLGLVGHPGYLTTGNNHGASNATTTDRIQPPISLAPVAIMYDSNRKYWSFRLSIYGLFADEIKAPTRYWPKCL